MSIAHTVCCFGEKHLGGVYFCFQIKLFNIVLWIGRALIFLYHFMLLFYFLWRLLLYITKRVFISHLLGTMITQEKLNLTENLQIKKKEEKYINIFVLALSIPKWQIYVGRDLDLQILIPKLITLLLESEFGMLSLNRKYFVTFPNRGEGYN